jgi:hypothetical protein
VILYDGIRKAAPALLLLALLGTDARSAGEERVPNEQGEYRPGGLAAFDEHPVPVAMRLGRITAVDLDGPQVIVDGRSYGFAPGAQVDLLAGFGAPTLLEVGMVVEIYYEEADGGGVAGRILAVYEVPESAWSPS